MTNQPDAYTLAAQAAADRARAEALQRGGAQTGPRLQSPMRRLSRNPVTRWVLSAVLLAAGTALAVDYLNTGLKARLQNVLRIPGFNGGKTVAEDAAQVSAAPQAKIDKEIVQPAQNDANEKVAKDSDIEEANRRLSGTTSKADQIRQSSPSLTFIPLGALLRRHLHEYDNYLVETTDDFGPGENFLGDQKQQLPAGKVTPFLFQDKTLATIKEVVGYSRGKDVTWLLVRFDNGTEGAMRLDDYQQLRTAPRSMAAISPNPAAPAPVPPAEDIGVMGIGDRQIALRGGTIYLYVPESGAWKKSMWSSCNEVSGEDAEKHAFECSDTSGTFTPNRRYRVHASISSNAPPAS